MVRSEVKSYVKGFSITKIEFCIISGEDFEFCLDNYIKLCYNQLLMLYEQLCFHLNPYERIIKLCVSPCAENAEI